MRRAYKVVFLGDSSVGKTSLIYQYLYNKFQDTTSTVGIDFLSNTFELDGHTIRMQLWDTAGQERFQSIISNYTRNAFVAAIVYAVDDPQSLRNAQMWIENFVLPHNRREDIHVLLVANKQDLEAGLFDPDGLAAAEAAELLGARLVKTSARTREGVEPLVQAINDCIRADIAAGGDTDAEDTNVLTAEPRKRRCC